jgi:hypothetical protein
MSVTITPITDHEQYDVNGNVVFRDALNNWSCKVDLSDKELRAFSRYEKLVINNPRFKKHTKATYNP